MGDVIETKRRYYSGLDADKASIPADGKALGDRYYATDVGFLYYWDTANWIIIPLDVITPGMLQTDAVETVKIKNLNVTEGKLGPLACAEAKIGNLAISAGKLQTDAVETVKIKDLNVTAAKAALGFGRYVSRRAAAPDKGVGDFVTDGTWKVDGLDLSGVVPAGAISVDLLVVLLDDAANSNFQIRPNAVDVQTALNVYTQVANIYISTAISIPIDANRLLDYMGDNLVFTAIFLTVMGYHT